MLTPSFELTQDDNFLYVKIWAPYAQISEVDVNFDYDTFWFSSKPYYLRLHLPGKVVYQENPSIKYDFDEKTFMIEVPKAENGEVFEGLDLITTLLAKKKSNNATPLIEVIEGGNEQEFGEVDWSCELSPPEDIKITGEQCGFGNSYSFDVFKLEEESAEIFEITQPQGKSHEVRRKERLEKESKTFNADHYVADLVEDEEIKQLIKYSSSWDKYYEEVLCNPTDSPDSKVNFTEQEKELLRKLPRKEYLLDFEQHKIALLGLVDILFAHAYNKRTTEGEDTVGSAWTINKISSTLSWLEEFSSVGDVVISCIRRSLIYPLYRHFELSLTVLEDVVKLLKIGRKAVMRCFMEIHQLFCHSEPRYIFNDLYINDYIVWIQTKSCTSNTFQSLANALEKVVLTKGHIGLNLVDIECLAAAACMNQDVHTTSPKSKRKQTSSICEKDDNSQSSHDVVLSTQLEKLSLKQKGLNDESSSSSSDEESTESSCSSSDEESTEDSSSFSDDESTESSSSSSDSQ